MPHYDCAPMFDRGRGWNDPDHKTCTRCHPPHPGPVDGVAPSSAAGWNAGVQCSGEGPTYTECHAENYDITGKPGAASI